MASLDTLGRRSRLLPQSTGKRVTPQARDILWFEKLAEHGPLPSSFLLHYARDTHRSEKRAKERLTDLFNEDNTPHGGPYLTRPPQQFRTIDSRYNQLVYDLAPAGKRAVQKAGLVEVGKYKCSGPWLHSCMVSCITASVELATLDRDDVRYLSQSYLLNRADAKLRSPTQVTDQVSGIKHRKDLIPDALFGLEYQTANGPRYRCFLLEADRATEPATSKNLNRKSWQRSLQQYEQYVGQERYRDHLKLKAPLLVLNVVTNEKRRDQMSPLVPKYAPSLQSRMLFQVWKDFGTVFKPPSPNASLLAGIWQRAGLEGFRIDT